MLIRILWLLTRQERQGGVIVVGVPWVVVGLAVLEAEVILIQYQFQFVAL